MSASPTRVSKISYGGFSPSSGISNSAAAAATQKALRRKKLIFLLTIIAACIIYNNFVVVSPTAFLINQQYDQQRQQKQQQKQHQQRSSSSSSSSSSIIDEYVHDLSNNNNHQQQQQHQDRRQTQATRTRSRNAPPSRPAVVDDGDDDDGDAVTQQKAVPATPPPPPPVLPDASTAKRPVRFIDTADLDQMKDVFAASWWQSKERFMQVNLTLIKNVEGDAFIPIKFAGQGFKDARMAVDWLDFSVEHLSKWWKLLGSNGVNYATGLLQSYVLTTSRGPSSTLMQSTLAVVPYGVQSHSHIWQSALTATLASLIKQGVGRVVVVGHYDQDEILTRSAFQYLSQCYGGGKFRRKKKEEHYFSIQVASSTLVFVHTDDVKSQFTAINIPRGGLIGIRDALLGKRPDASNWVGKSPSQWKYIFLTEADQILNARLSPEFFTAMDEGRIIVPHRIQPIPHWLDLESMYIKSGENSVRRRSVPMVPSNISKTVFHLNPDTDSCCDAGLESKLKLPEEKPCGDFWWMCGLRSSELEPLAHLLKYQFVRISTGVVHLAATEHSRKCSPIRGSEGCPAASS